MYWCFLAMMQVLVVDDPDKFVSKVAFLHLKEGSCLGFLPNFESTEKLFQLFLAKFYCNWPKARNAT